ncbi:uncharacterized protein LOC142972863 isoform X3 [Anticarsia gemmatalis]|uniref:uncharacterized protein LOC142972863 isoform X3 n=1 Tax=Anticarsia gemmatalis TaxID=129554 RepID=UPI003F75DD63
MGSRKQREILKIALGISEYPWSSSEDEEELPAVQQFPENLSRNRDPRLARRTPADALSTSGDPSQLEPHQASGSGNRAQSRDDTLQPVPWASRVNNSRSQNSASCPQTSRTSHAADDAATGLRSTMPPGESSHRRRIRVIPSANVARLVAFKQFTREMQNAGRLRASSHISQQSNAPVYAQATRTGARYSTPESVPCPSRQPGNVRQSANASDSSVQLGAAGNVHQSTMSAANTPATSMQSETSAGSSVQPESVHHQNMQAANASGQSSQQGTAPHPTVQSANPSGSSVQSGNVAGPAGAAPQPTTQPATAPSPSVQLGSVDHSTMQSANAPGPSMQPGTANYPTMQSANAPSPSMQQGTAGYPTNQSENAPGPSTQAGNEGDPTMQSGTAGNPSMQSENAPDQSMDSENYYDPPFETRRSEPYIGFGDTATYNEEDIIHDRLLLLFFGQTAHPPMHITYPPHEPEFDDETSVGDMSPAVTPPPPGTEEEGIPFPPLPRVTLPPPPPPPPPPPSDSPAPQDQASPARASPGQAAPAQAPLDPAALPAANSAAAAENNNNETAAPSGTEPQPEPAPSRPNKRKRRATEDAKPVYTFGEFNMSLLSLLECPVCLDWMEPPFSQCRRGHLVCAVCRTRLTECAVCRTTFSSVRNRAMEGVAEMLRYPCRHGCGRQMLLRRRTLHENNCASRRFACPAPACPLLDPLRVPELAEHFQCNHRSLLKVGSRHHLTVKLNTEQHDMWLVVALNDYFMVRVDIAPSNNFRVEVTYMGPQKKAKNFIYTVILQGLYSSRRLEYSRNTPSDVDTSPENVARQDCFHLSYEQALNYIRAKNKQCQPENPLNFVLEIKQLVTMDESRDESE